MSDHDYSVGGFDDFFPDRAGLTGPATLKFDMAFTLAVPTRTHARDLLAAAEAESADSWSATVACSPGLS